MNRISCLILGDDFTPARTFEQAISTAMGDDTPGLKYRTLDFEPHEMMPTESDTLREAFGDVARVARLVADSELLVTTFAPVTSDVLNSAPDLRAIACGRGGPVNIDVEAATTRGIPVLYAPGRNAQAVAEFTIAGMINLMRRVPAALRHVRQGEWRVSREDTFEKPSGPELGGRTLGLIGFGQVGQIVARLAAAFGARILVHDPWVDEGAIESLGSRSVSLARLLEESEIVSIHARLPPGADPILGARQFLAMARKPYLINTARAGAIDHGALLQALESGRVAGAFLDVHAREPLPPGDPLLSFDQDRLMLTPHAAGVSFDIPENTARILARGLRQLLKNARPDHVINPQCLETCFRRLRSRQEYRS